MEYVIHYEPDYYFEGIQILSNIYREKSIERLTDEIIKANNSRITADQLFPLFDDINRLMKRVEESVAVQLKDKKADLLFRDTGSPQPFAHIFYLHRHSEKSANYSRFKALCSYICVCFSNLAEEPDLSSADEYHRFVDTLECSKEIKYDLIYTYNHFDELNEYVGTLIDEASNAIRQELPSLKRRIVDQMEEISNEVDENGPKIFENYFGSRIKLDEKINIYPMFALPNVMVLNINTDPSANSMHIGLCAAELKKLLLKTTQQSLATEEFLKQLSDSTKLKIIKIIKDKPFNGSQLSKQLGLTNATISYHMSSLLGVGAINVNKEGNRVFYSLNQTKIKAFLSDLTEMLYE